jgi:pimeloyl-ACP methyl ester carboxylesterase/DNA-binding CsgD family transcriptional regulator
MNMSDVNQHVRFCETADGTRLAFAVGGHGPPLVRTANWVSHLEYEWGNEVRRFTLEALTRRFTLLRYDQRGCGLSDWNVENISFDVWVEDLNAVVDAAGFRRFALMGSSQGCAIAIAYAARYPERVTHLMLYGGFVLGRLKRVLTEQQREEALTLIKIIELGWGKGTPEFRQVFTTQFMPDATLDQQRAFNELQRVSTSPENAVRIVSQFDGIDVRKAAAQIRVPTLVLHSRGDARVPFEEGRRMAALIPGARFVPLESRNHVLFHTEPAWQQFVDEVISFPADTAADSRALETPLVSSLTAREKAVLELVAQGRRNSEIARTLSLSEKTVRNYLSVICDKLQVSGRSQAIVLAREAGFGFQPRRPET